MPNYGIHRSIVSLEASITRTIFTDSWLLIPPRINVMFQYSKQHYCSPWVAISLLISNKDKFFSWYVWISIFSVMLFMTLGEIYVPLKLGYPICIELMPSWHTMVHTHVGMQPIRRLVCHPWNCEILNVISPVSIISQFKRPVIGTNSVSFSCKNFVNLCNSFHVMSLESSQQEDKTIAFLFSFSLS